MQKKLALAAIPAALALAPSLAFADEGAIGKDNWPSALVDRPLTLAKGMVEIRGEVIIGLSTDSVGKPFAIAPDIMYGVDDRLTVGLTHDAGLCLSGEDGHCPNVYDDLGVHADYALIRSGSLALAAHGEVKVASIDTGTLSLPVGLAGRFTSGKVGVFFDPTLSIGLTDRDANKETLAIPVKIAYQATPELATYLDTGLGGVSMATSVHNGAQLSEIGDTFAIPIGVGVLYNLGKIDVGAEFLLPAPFGSELANDIGFDARALLLHANVRL